MTSEDWSKRDTEIKPFSDRCVFGSARDARERTTGFRDKGDSGRVMRGNSVTVKTLLKSGFIGGAAAFACTLLQASTSAEAGNRDSFTELYKFDKPTNGVSGHVSGYYCDYQKKPNIVCTVDAGGREKCVRDGWQLRQYCY